MDSICRLRKAIPPPIYTNLIEFKVRSLENSLTSEWFMNSDAPSLKFIRIIEILISRPLIFQRHLLSIFINHLSRLLFPSDKKSQVEGTIKAIDRFWNHSSINRLKMETKPSKMNTAPSLPWSNEMWLRKIPIYSPTCTDNKRLLPMLSSTASLRSNQRGGPCWKRGNRLSLSRQKRLQVTITWLHEFHRWKRIAFQNTVRLCIEFSQKSWKKLRRHHLIWPNAVQKS